MMKRQIIAAVAAFMIAGLCASAQGQAQDTTGVPVKEKKALLSAEVKDHLQNHFKLYGFVRNYFAYDNRESKSGTGDLFYWLPLDRSINDEGDDINAQNQFRFLSLTSRVGLDVSGYRVKNVEFGGVVEADFYAGLSGSTGTAQLRLRQAFATVRFCDLGKRGNASVNLKMGQAWHPMSADLPDIFSLESGAPFNAFSRTPQVTADFNFNKEFSFTASALWQMQYTSSGPVWTKGDDGTYSWKSNSSADFIKYSCTPEFYFAVNYRKGGFLGRAGFDLLSIKPRKSEYDQKGKATYRVGDRITTVSPYVYLQYTKGAFAIKGKTIYSSAGEHMNLMSGYALQDDSDARNWKYVPLHSSSSWVTVAYGKKFKGVLMLGYIQNLGTYEPMKADNDGHAKSSDIFFQKNGFASINRMYRIQPDFTYNVGKFTLGIEYMLTGVQYAGDESGKVIYNAYGLGVNDLHWVLNHRVQAMVKFNF